MAFIKFGKPSANKSDTPVQDSDPTAAEKDIDESSKIDYYASREAGQANIDHILLDSIDMDPTNPRTKGIDPRRLRAIVPPFLIVDPKHKLYDAAKVREFDVRMAQEVDVISANDPKRGAQWKGFFEDLIPLRDNIRLLGVKQAIEVRRNGKRYEIVFGHRRYLASLLAGERNIPARVVAEDAKGLKHAQASENIHQQELTLGQKLEAIEAALKDYHLTPSSPHAQAAQVLGMERSGIGRYMRILEKGSPALREAIDAGVVKNILHAAEYASLSDDALREAIAANELGIRPSAKKKKNQKVREGRGAPKKFIITPKIASTRVIETILEKFESAPKDKKMDWSDKNKVNELWVSFIERLDSECQRSAE